MCDSTEHGTRETSAVMAPALTSMQRDLVDKPCIEDLFDYKTCDLATKCQTLYDYVDFAGRLFDAMYAYGEGLAFSAP